MKKIIILQNSIVSFCLDAKKIYQPRKYQLYLIVNEFGYNIANETQQKQYYKNIDVTNNFRFENILSIINLLIKNTPEFDIITNSEETMEICGKIRVFFGLDIEDYSRFYNKHVMKMRLKNCRTIHTPKYEIFTPSDHRKGKMPYLAYLIENLKFPLFAKPIKLYSSINLKRINNYTELFKWAESTSTNDEDYFEIDEFIEGTMFHCDSFIKNKKILFTFVSKNSRPCYNFTIGEIKGTIVLPLTHPDAINLSIIAEKILLQLGMPNAGVTHLELFKTVDNKVYFVEIAHRSPGCLIPQMYLEHANIDTVTSHFLLQIDNEYYPKRVSNVFAAWACYPKIPGKVIALNDPPAYLQSQCKVNWSVKVGDKISTYSMYGRDYIGTIFMTHPTFNLLYNEWGLINNLNLCVIGPEERNKQLIENYETSTKIEHLAC